MNFEERIIELYTKFRQEIDEICIPEILKCVNIKPIWYEDKQVGLFCYAQQPFHIFIDCIYVEPECRRKGLAKKEVLEFYANNNELYKDIRLHIINENKVAEEFWRGLFDLEFIEGNSVDTLYRIRGLRK